MKKFSVEEIEALDLDMFEALLETAIAEPFIITSDEGQDVVLLGAEQFNRLVENAQRILDAVVDTDQPDSV